MRQFILPMPDVYIGGFQERQIKNSNKEVIGVRTLVSLEFRGGFVLVDVDKGFSESLKIDSNGDASVSMQPSMSGKTLNLKDGNSFGIIDTGFDNFKLVGFTPKK